MDHHFDACPDPSLCPLHGYPSWSSGTNTQGDLIMGGTITTASTADSHEVLGLVHTSASNRVVGEHDTSNISGLSMMAAGESSSSILRSLLQPCASSTGSANRGSMAMDRHDAMAHQYGSTSDPYHAVRDRRGDMAWAGSTVEDQALNRSDGQTPAYGGIGYMAGTPYDFVVGGSVGQTLVPQQASMNPEPVRHLIGLSAGQGAADAAEGSPQLPQDLYQMMSSLSTRPDHHSSVPPEATVDFMTEPHFPSEEPDLLVGRVFAVILMSQQGFRSPF